jgi:hypothetical protein
VALRDTSAFDEWIAQENPPYVVARDVEAWIAGLQRRTEQWPSVPIPDLCDAESQTRQVEVAGVTVIYTEWYPVEGSPPGPGPTDLVWVGRI